MSSLLFAQFCQNNKLSGKAGHIKTGGYAGGLLPATSMDKKTLKRLLWGDFSVKRMLKSAIFIYGCLCIWGYFFSESIIFQPHPSSYQDSKQILKLTTANGMQISAVYLPNPAAKYTLLFSHGNGEDLGDDLFMLRELQQMGFAVFAYDYQGYGTSQGKPTELNSYKDIDAAYNYLTQQLAIPSSRIIAYGRSIGSGPSVDLAYRQPLAGLILESPFTRVFLVRTRIPIVPFDKFRNIDKIKSVRCPVLVIHGKRDRVIPFSHGEQVFAAANQPKLSFWIDEADHNDVMEVAGENYAKKLREFVELVERSH